ncbi:DUF2255 family protein [Streptomyces sp. NPDC059862]|uniref:DUF2255 family protein n=1 Tax=unclassified Streptomyces TaxID=2593676 RepID=UPI003626AFAC
MPRAAASTQRSAGVETSRAGGAGAGWAIGAGGVTKDVTFVDADEEIDDAVDAAYRSKYGRCAASVIQAVTSQRASSPTRQLVPRQVPGLPQTPVAGTPATAHPEHQPPQESCAYRKRVRRHVRDRTAHPDDDRAA